MGLSQDDLQLPNYQALAMALAHEKNLTADVVLVAYRLRDDERGGGHGEHPWYGGFTQNNSYEVRDFLIQGHSMEVIAWKFGMSLEELQKGLKRFPLPKPRTVYMSLKQAQEIAKCRNETEMAYELLAKKFGFSKHSLPIWLKRYGLWDQQVYEHGNHLAREQAQEIHDRHAAGETYRKLAVEFDCQIMKFRRLLKEYGLYENRPIRRGRN